MPESDAIPRLPTQMAEEAAQFRWDGHSFQAGIGIAASGGGFRAMLFHVGAFLRLNELQVLQQAKRIAGVSGGSIATGYLAVVWNDLAQAGFANFREVYMTPMLAFARQKLDVIDAVAGALPWTSAAQQVADSYDRYLFKGRTLADLPDAPFFVFCATNLQTGALFRFTKAYAGDYVVGRIDVPKIRLALAVAASSAFPPILSPLVLKMPPGDFGNWPEGESPVPDDQIGPFRERVVLTDGGVYDNHGLEPILKSYATVLVSDGGMPFARTAELDRDWASQLYRIVSVTDNQVRALRRRDLIDRLKAGNAIADETAIVAQQAHGRLGAYWGVDTDPGKLTLPGALPCNVETVHALAAVSTRLSDPGELVSKQLVNWGYAICDRSVRAHWKGAPAPAPAAWPYPEAPIGP